MPGRGPSPTSGPVLHPAVALPVYPLGAASSHGVTALGPVLASASVVQGVGVGAGAEEEVGVGATSPTGATVAAPLGTPSLVAGTAVRAGVAAMTRWTVTARARTGTEFFFNRLRRLQRSLHYHFSISQRKYEVMFSSLCVFFVLDA